MSTGQAPTQVNDQPVIVYGAFSSARSYLASGRVALLEADGLYVDWRIVGDRTGFGIQPTDLERFEATRREMERVVSALLPGERLPYSLAGSLCRTGAAAAGYAQAYDLGVASPIRRLLFEALWVQGVDLDDEKSIRTLILDRLPGLSDVGTGSPTHDDQSARSLISQWAWEWDCLGRPPLPAMAVEGRVRRCGDEAVTWFETQLMHRDVEIGSERSGAGKAGQPECLDLIPRARPIGAPHRPGFPPKGRTRSMSPVIQENHCATRNGFSIDSRLNTWRRLRMPRNDYTDRSRAMPRRQSRDTEVDRSLMTRFSSSHVATNRIGEVLQNTLVELLDLALQAKHARWTVTGPALLPLHTQLDALSVQMQAAADEVAERAVTIGYAPDGRCSTVATDSPLPELPTGLLADHVVVDAIGRALSVVTEGVHGRVERLDQLDQVSHDMLIGVLRGLDKQRWMFEAQRA